MVKIWKWLKLVNSVPFIKKTLVNHVSFHFDHLTDFHHFTVNEEKLQTSKLCQVKIWLKLLNSVPFIKKTPVNQVYIRIWSLWLTFTILQNEDMSILLGQNLKIWKWLKLLNSVPFIKKTLVNQVYIRIWSFWLTFTDLQWMRKNSEISQFSSFLLRPR